MKSKVISYPDPESIVLTEAQRRVERRDIEAEIQEELEFIQRKHSEIVFRDPGEPVESGDTLVINTRCEAAGSPNKFNKSGLGLSLGKFFYDKNIELALLGKSGDRPVSVGSTVKVNAGKDGEWPVEVEVVSAQHTRMIPLTDDDFKEEGRLNDVDVNNREEFLEFLRYAITDAENLDHFYTNIQDDVAIKLVAASEFEIDEDELARAKKRWFKEVEDLPDYAATEDDLGFIEYVQEMLGSTSETREELIEELDPYYENAFKYNLILLDLAKDEPDPTREQFEKGMQEMFAQGYTEEDLASINDYDQYVNDTKLEYGISILREILEKQLEN